MSLHDGETDWDEVSVSSADAGSASGMLIAGDDPVDNTTAISGSASATAEPTFSSILAALSNVRVETQSPDACGQDGVIVDGDTASDTSACSDNGTSEGEEDTVLIVRSRNKAPSDGPSPQVVENTQSKKVESSQLHNKPGQVLSSTVTAGEQPNGKFTPSICHVKPSSTNFSKLKAHCYACQCRESSGRFCYVCSNSHTYVLSELDHQTKRANTKAEQLLRMKETIKNVEKDLANKTSLADVRGSQIAKLNLQLSEACEQLEEARENEREADLLLFERSTKHQQELDEIELNYAQDIENVRTENKACLAEIRSLKAQNATEAKSIPTLVAEYERRVDAATRTEKFHAQKATEARKELAAAKEQLGTASSDLDRAKERADSLEAELARTDEKLLLTKEELGRYKAELTHVRSKLESTEKDLLRTTEQHKEHTTNAKHENEASEELLRGKLEVLENASTDALSVIYAQKDKLEEELEKIQCQMAARTSDLEAKLLFREQSHALLTQQYHCLTRWMKIKDTLMNELQKKQGITDEMKYKEYEDIAEKIRRQQVTQDDEQEGVKLENYLRQDQVRLAGLMQREAELVKELEQSNASVSTYKAEVAKYKSEVDVLKAKNANLNKEVNRWVQDWQDAEKRHGQCVGKKTYDQMKERKEAEMNSIRTESANEWNECRQLAQRLKDHMEGYENKIQNLETVLSETERKSDGYSGILAKVEHSYARDMDDYKARVAGLQNERSKALKEATDARASIKDLEQRASAAERMVKLNNLRHIQMEQRCTLAEQELKRLKKLQATPSPSSTETRSAMPNQKVEIPGLLAAMQAAAMESNKPSMEKKSQRYSGPSYMTPIETPLRLPPRRPGVEPFSQPVTFNSTAPLTGAPNAPHPGASLNDIVIHTEDFFDSVMSGALKPEDVLAKPREAAEIKDESQNTFSKPDCDCICTCYCSCDAEDYEDCVCDCLGCTCPHEKVKIANQGDPHAETRGIKIDDGGQLLMGTEKKDAEDEPEERMSSSMGTVEGANSDVGGASPTRHVPGEWN